MFSRDRGIKTPRLFPWLSSTGIDLLHIIARQLFLDRSLALKFFPLLSVKLSLSLSRISSLNSFLPLHLSYIHTRNLSLSLSRSRSFSPTDFTFTFIIFLVPFIFKKTFSGPFFFFEILTHSLQSFIHSDSRYRSANERRAFFHIYLLLRSLPPFVS